MAKKTIVLSLEQKVIDVGKKEAEKRGISFSAYVSILLAENALKNIVIKQENN